MASDVCKVGGFFRLLLAESLIGPLEALPAVGHLLICSFLFICYPAAGFVNKDTTELEPSRFGNNSLSSSFKVFSHSKFFYFIFAISALLALFSIAALTGSSLSKHSRDAIFTFLGIKSKSTFFSYWFTPKLTSFNIFFFSYELLMDFYASSFNMVFKVIYSLIFLFYMLSIASI